MKRPLLRKALSGGGLLLISAVGIYVYARYVDAVYPIKNWLVWQLLMLWGYVALANLAWFAVGNWIVRRLLRLTELPLLEAAVLSAALGVVTFTELMYLAGAAGLYGPTFALVLPLLLLALGARDLREWLRSYRAARAEAGPTSAAGLWLWAVGGALTGVVYLGLLSPDAINYDATWCHLTIAQDYAREGGIVAFPGDYSKNVPQLASIVHTWGFSVPGLDKAPLRWMLALHQEFGLFLWTLAGVAAAVRRMASDQGLRGTWAAFYLFPIIFVYDHNLGGAADHVAAFFVVPGVLAASRLLESLSWQRCCAMVLCMAGGFLTKYQAFYWILPLLLVVGFKVLYLAIRHRRSASSDPMLRRTLLTVTLLVCVALPLLVAPHFLKNWVFYRDPVYPFLQHAFPGTRPTVENGGFLMANQFTDENWVPQGSVWRKLGHAFGLMLTFSLEPHYSFTKNFPAFGSLFTLLLPALLFIQRRRAKLLFVFVSLSTLFIWGFTFNVDRNLQVFMPVLVATTGAILVEVWCLGWPARVAIAPLVAFQLLWGGDAIFYSSQDRIRQAFELIGSGFAGNAKTRFNGYRSAYVAVGKALPADAHVVLHTAHVSLGIDRRLVLDWAGFQGLIGYTRVHNASELYDMYRGHGLTHVVYIHGERPAPSIQEEIVFQSLMAKLGPPSATAGGFRIVRLPKQAPAREHRYRVLTLGLYGYGSGVFPIEKLTTNEYIAPTKRVYAAAPAPAPSSAEELEALNVDAVVVGAGYSPNPAQSAFLRRGFSSIVQYSAQQTIYLRKSGAETRR